MNNNLIEALKIRAELDPGAPDCVVVDENLGTFCGFPVKVDPSMKSPAKEYVLGSLEDYAKVSIPLVDMKVDELLVLKAIIENRIKELSPQEKPVDKFEQIDSKFGETKELQRAIIQMSKSVQVIKQAIDGPNPWIKEEHNDAPVYCLLGVVERLKDVESIRALHAAVLPVANACLATTQEKLDSLLAELSDLAKPERRPLL